MGHISDQSPAQRALQTLFRGLGSGAQQFSAFNQGQIDREFQQQQLADAAGRRAAKGESALSKALLDRETEGVQSRAAQRFAIGQGLNPEQAGNFVAGGGKISGLTGIKREERLSKAPTRSPFGSANIPPNFIGQIRKATQGRQKEFSTLLPGVDERIVDEQRKKDVTREEFQALTPFIEQLLGPGSADSVGTILGLGQPKSSPATSQSQGFGLLQELLRTNPNTTIGLPPGPQTNDTTVTPDEALQELRRRGQIP